MTLKRPYLLFLGDAADPLAAKTARGLLDWRPDWCLGQHRLPGCVPDLGLPDMTPAEAAEAGAGALVIGVVNAGGVLPAGWVAAICDALAAGLDIVSGLHAPLAENPEIAAAAAAHGGALVEIRRPPEGLGVGKGVPRPGRRLLAVGTDCSVGKKYTALCLERDMRAAGFDADFRATGQTGILIAERGVPLDAVIADFISGAAEWVSPAAAATHWDVIEGQGSLFHPSFAGVTLGLLHGAQPDAFVVCHAPGRDSMRGVAHPLPTIQEVIDATIAAGRRTSPDIACIGISLNTHGLDEDAAHALIAATAEAHGLPTVDPLRFGARAIVDAIARRFGGPG